MANWFARSNSTPRRAAVRARSSEVASPPEAKCIFVNIDLREAGPQVRLPVVPFYRALEPTLERGVIRGRDLLPVGKILELPLRRSEISVIFLPGRVPK